MTPLILRFNKLGQFIKAFYDVSFSKDGNILATAGRGEKEYFVGSGIHGLCLWDLRTESKIELEYPKDSAYNVRFHPVENSLAWTNGSQIHLWNYETGESRTLSEPRHGVLDLAFHPSGNWLASGGTDGTARLWDTRTGTMIKVVAQHDSQNYGEVYAVAFSADGSFFAEGSDDYMVTVWDVHTWTKLERFKTKQFHEGVGVRGLAFSSEGRFLVAGIEDGEVLVRDRAGERSFYITSAVINQPYTRIAFNPHSNVLAVGDQESLRLWGPADLLGGNTGYLLAENKGEWGDGINNLTFSSDGSLLAAAMGDQARIWRLSFSGILTSG